MFVSVLERQIAIPEDGCSIVDGKQLSGKGTVESFFSGL